MADSLNDLLVQRIAAKVKSEMPDAAGVNVQPMGMIGKFLSPGADAITTPFGNVAYNPDVMAGQSPDQIGDTLTHEFTHAKQFANQGLMDKLLSIINGVKRGFGGDLPYGQRPEELEAYQAEHDRATRQGRSSAPMPSFTQPGQWQGTQGDIMLPGPRRK